jgi:hypothetical protein
VSVAPQSKIIIANPFAVDPFLRLCLVASLALSRREVHSGAYVGILTAEHSFSFYILFVVSMLACCRSV